MTERMMAEFELVRRYYSAASINEAFRWIQIPNWLLPPGMWNFASVTVGFRIPENYPGQEPYGFYVLPYDLRLSSGQSPDRSQLAQDTPDASTWLKFSWTPEDRWAPAAEIERGSNLLNFAGTIRNRLSDPV